QRSEREIWWLYGARNGSEHPFAEEVRRLLAALPGARSHICYSHPAPGDRLGIDYTAAGHLSEELLGQLGVPRSIDGYLCGPPAFMRDVPGWLAAYGIDADRVQAEIFGAGPALTPGIASQPATAPHDPDGPAGSGPWVAFARSGLTVNWDPRFPSLLDMAEACSVPVRWSCRTGVCHTCETGLLAGSVDYSLDPVEPPADGNVLICCSQPTDAIVLDL
ncbi:MAG TPA: 2Fe-2S iron-sulfur cluster-binding protein, partial [Micromonosporaceae bacterium]